MRRLVLFCQVSEAGWEKHRALCLWLREAVAQHATASVESGQGMSQEAFADVLLQQFGDAWLHKTYFLYLCPAVLQSLLEGGPSAARKRGASPLDFSRGGALDVFRLLLQKCPAAANKVNMDGMLQMHEFLLQVSLSGVQQVAALIQAYPAAVILADKAGFMPLHHAVLLQAASPKRRISKTLTGSTMRRRQTKTKTNGVFGTVLSRSLLSSGVYINITRQHHVPMPIPTCNGLVLISPSSFVPIHSSCWQPPDRACLPLPLFPPLFVLSSFWQL